MADLKFAEDGNEFLQQKVTFRGPPFGIVTDSIVKIGLAKKRRDAELILVGIAVIAVIIAFIIGGSASDGPVPIPAGESDASKYIH